MGVKKDKEHSNGLTGAAIRAVFMIMRFTVKERITGRIVIIRVNGVTTRWMEKVYLHGITEKCIEDTILMERKTVMASLHGLMERHMKETGSKINNTEKELSWQRMENARRVYGRTANELNGHPKVSKCLDMLRKLE